MSTATVPRTSAFTWQRWFIVGVCLVFLAIGVKYSIKATGSGDRNNRSAFLRWRSQLQHLDSEDIYLQYNFPYPPIMAMLLITASLGSPLANATTAMH